METNIFFYSKYMARNNTAKILCDLLGSWQVTSSLLTLLHAVSAGSTVNLVCFTVRSPTKEVHSPPRRS